MTEIVVQSLIAFVILPAFIALALTILAYMNCRQRLACITECPSCGAALSVGSIQTLRAIGGVPYWRVCRGCCDAEQAQLRADPAFNEFVDTMRALVPDQTPHPQEERPCH